MPLITQFLQRVDKLGSTLVKIDGVLSVPVAMLLERSTSPLNTALSSSLSTYLRPLYSAMSSILLHIIML